jgi:hypothetical protein
VAAFKLNTNMTEVKQANKQPKSWIQSGTCLTHQEFEKEIKKAEKGPFHSVQKSMENFELWLTEREKK